MRASRLAVGFGIAGLLYGGAVTARFAALEGAVDVAQLRAAAITHVLVTPGQAPPEAMRDALIKAGISLVFAEPGPVAQAGSDAHHGQSSEFLVLKEGLWPKIRGNVAFEGGNNLAFAGASSDPWVDCNGSLLLYAQALVPESRPVLVYGPEPDVAPRIGSRALALAEAAVFGGSFAIPTGALTKPATPRGIADWRRTVAQLRFIAGHEDWFGGSEEAAVAVLADRLEPVAEVMNLLIRKNINFQACLRNRWPAKRPDVLVSVGQPPLAGAVADRIAAWRSAGTALFLRDGASDPVHLANEVRSALGDRCPFRIANAPELIGNLVALANGNRVLHVLNYGIDVLRDVAIELSEPVARATLYAPDSADGRMLEIRNRSIVLPEIGAYGAVLLQSK